MRGIACGTLARKCPPLHAEDIVMYSMRTAPLVAVGNCNFAHDCFVRVYRRNSPSQIVLGVCG
mgnify:FL=1